MAVTVVVTAAVRTTARAAIARLKVAVRATVMVMTAITWLVRRAMTCRDLHQSTMTESVLAVFLRQRTFGTTRSGQRFHKAVSIVVGRFHARYRVIM
jgi:hypothetical protein